MLAINCVTTNYTHTVGIRKDVVFSGYLEEKWIRKVHYSKLVWFVFHKEQKASENGAQPSIQPFVHHLYDKGGRDIKYTPYKWLYCEHRAQTVTWIFQACRHEIHIFSWQSRSRRLALPPTQKRLLRGRTAWESAESQELCEFPMCSNKSCTGSASRDQNQTHAGPWPSCVTAMDFH